MKLKKNMGLLDRAIRISLAILIAIFYFSSIITGTTALLLGILAVIFVLTSFVSFCPLYLPFGISTKKE